SLPLTVETLTKPLAATACMGPSTTCPRYCHRLPGESGKYCSPSEMVFGSDAAAESTAQMPSHPASTRTMIHIGRLLFTGSVDDGPGAMYHKCGEPGKPRGPVHLPFFGPDGNNDAPFPITMDTPPSRPDDARRVVLVTGGSRGIGRAVCLE